MRAAPFAIVLAALVCGRAQAEAVRGTATVYTSYPAAGKKLADTAVLVFLLRGKVVAQGEIALGTVKIFDNLPVGTYEVRAEGAGLASIFKRGIVVTARGDTDVRFPMKAGKGATVVTYSTSLPERDELEALLKRLETAVRKLEKAR
jgi:hypothetical protein